MATQDATRRDPLDPTRHRPFVDGLRAVAVLAVVAHHAHAPFATGGYVGVDVFFVISGFLIIHQITSALERERFSLAEFWARRVLRILPPYLLVVVTSMLLGALLLITPAEIAGFGDQVLHSALMVVNHLFLLEQGYFDRAGQTKPLLHLWSLAVEEQFYLVAPLALAAGWLVVRRAQTSYRRAVLAGAIGSVLFALSLAACIAFTGDPDGTNPAFYVMPLRAWELLLGGGIGLASRSFAKLPRTVADALAVLGLAAIGIACFAYTPSTPFPSYRALLPVVGAAVVIGVGVARPDAFAIRALATRPMTFIGLVSYAYYLWHWPLISFGRILHFQQPSLLRDVLLGVIVPFGLAVLTYRFVERPIRTWRQQRGEPVGWKMVGAGVATCAVVALVGRVGFAARSQPGSDAPSQLARCVLTRLDVSAGCSVPGSRGVGVLIGDSHASAAYPELQRDAARADHVLALAGFDGCGPLLAMERKADVDRRARCARQQANAREHILDPESRISFAILVAQWAFHTEGLQVSGTGTLARNQAAAFETDLRDTIDVLERAGARRVLVIGSVPIFEEAPECVARADRLGVPRDRHCSERREHVEARRRKAMAWTAHVLRDRPQVRFIDPIDAFCDATMCRPYDGDALLYGEGSHLSSVGTRRLIERHRADFDWVFDSAIAVGSR